MIKKDFRKECKQWIHSKQREIAYTVAFVLLIWFVMYPEFSITSECCKAVDESGQVIEHEMTDRELALIKRWKRRMMKLLLRAGSGN